MSNTKINIGLSILSIKNLDFIQEHEDIDNRTQAIKTAINFYANYLRREDAKVNVYSKPAKSSSVQEPRKNTEEEERERGAQLCVLDFEGVICDEDGNEDPTGMYCKYDSFEQVSSNKIFKAPDMINPLDRLSGLLANGEKYRNTDARKVRSFENQGGKFSIIDAKPKS